MREFLLIGYGPDHSKGLALFKVFGYGGSDAILLHQVSRVAWGFLQAIFEVIFWGFPLQIVIKVSKDPEEGGEEGLKVCGL